MTRKDARLRDWMSRLPTELERTDTVGRAVELMADGGFGHVPVLDGSRLFGIVSRQDTDLLVAERGLEALAEPVETVCVRDVLLLPPDTPLGRVAKAMLDRDADSALVVDGDVLVGIFTGTDALRALADPGA